VPKLRWGRDKCRNPKGETPMNIKDRESQFSKREGEGGSALK
jgi:hypothetical protein